MPKSFVDLTAQAEAAGLKLTVWLSKDRSEVRFSLNNGEGTDFDSSEELASWLDGYLQRERVRADQKLAAERARSETEFATERARAAEASSRRQHC